MGLYCKPIVIHTAYHYSFAPHTNSCLHSSPHKQDYITTPPSGGNPEGGKLTAHLLPQGACAKSGEPYSLFLSYGFLHSLTE